MSILDIILIGVGLSMDACAVGISNSLSFKNLSKKNILFMVLSFGFFQGLMPFLGFFTGNIFYGIIHNLAEPVVCVILFALGLRMMSEVYSTKDKKKTVSSLSMLVILSQAVATSVDAFAVGISFSAVGVNIYLASSIIAVITFVLSFIAVYVGKMYGSALGEKAGLLGGIILIILGVKTLL